MTENQKYWEISVKMSSKDCPKAELVPPEIEDTEDGKKYNNFGQIRCGHKKGGGMLCSITRKEYCPLRWELDYPLNPELQVNKDDV